MLNWNSHGQGLKGSYQLWNIQLVPDIGQRGCCMCSLIQPLQCCYYPLCRGKKGDKTGGKSVLASAKAGVSLSPRAWDRALSGFCSAEMAFPFPFDMAITWGGGSRDEHEDNSHPLCPSCCTHKSLPSDTAQPTVLLLLPGQTSQGAVDMRGRVAWNAFIPTGSSMNPLGPRQSTKQSCTVHGVCLPATQNLPQN